MNFKFLFITTLLINAFVNVFSQQRPKLAVGIVVDQMRYDYIYKYWDKYGNGGFKKLVSEGYFCKNNHYNYVPTYTGPGHASIYTGTTPSYHGIVANDWFDRDSKKFMYCVQDDSIKAKSSEQNKSANNLLSTTITDELELFTNKKAIVIGCSYKDRGAILPAGHMADAAYWLDKKTGAFVTSPYYTSENPTWVNNFNDLKLADQYLQGDWNTMLPIEQYTESIADDNIYEGNINGGGHTFPYNLKELKQKSGSYDIIGRTPFGNSILKDFALYALDNTELGKDNITDFLCVSFSSTDLVGHQFTPTSIEVEDTYLRLDKDIEALLNKLNSKIGKDNYILFLTADHAAAFNPNYLMDNKIPAGYFKEDEYKDSLKLFMLQKFGTTAYLDTIINCNVYLNREALSKRWYPLEYFQDHLVKYTMQFEGVRSVITSENANKNEYSNSSKSFNYAGMNYKRSGDLQLILQPGWFDPHKGKNGYVLTGTTHGTSYTYDTHVPLLWYGANIPAGETARKTEITDIATTLSFLLNIPLPSAAIGQPILEILPSTQKETKQKDEKKDWNRW